ncbi:penicillin-binding transpeptidase domain-containing protein [Paenibacillus herberti]|uniref:Stage V sporulation protein D n=1 Tax=Paenibacillus herberti TaxID=1619309 RepID=A0A229P0N8_9BACL|nr:penicillin-binding transpeptidase domain-containing protein [Paenibacillus herberti]OXM15677.1 stage V sporulation protein D [Paenibacillus herberti]
MANNPIQSNTIKRIKMRTVVVGGVITLLFLILISRVFYVQVVQADFWLSEAKAIWKEQDTIPAERGTISDRKGNMLAMNIPAYTVVVNPKLLNELGIAEEAAKGLAELLGKSEQEVLKQTTMKNSKGEYLQYRELRPEGWNIDKAKADKVIAFRDNLKKSYEERTDIKIRNTGITLNEGSKRFYPNNSLAAHVLGYVNKEGAPVIGLEVDFNKQLEGQDGKVVYEKDGNRVQLANGNAQLVPAVDGSDIQLTLDSEIQNYLEVAMKKAYEKYEPKSITAIAADPNTMEILAMGNMPTYNPNEYSKSNVGNFFNHAIGSTYEPGSTFKIITLASAVEEGKFNPNATYKSGSIVVTGTRISDVNTAGWGTISYLEGLKRSSNVSFVKLGLEQLGKEKLVNYFENFGFGKRTGIELKNEVKGTLNINYPFEVATSTFGQGVAVTPIQQIAAVAAVANGGKLMKPHIVKSIKDPATGKVTETKPEMVRQVISAETSRKVGGYLEQVVSDKEIGSGRNAAIPGYRVAGKTGTAEKSDGVGYSKDEYVVSFIGYAPVENPKIVVYVTVDSPNNPMVSGGTVAAPVFKEIVSQSLRYMGVKPDAKAVKDGGKQGTQTVPDLKNKGIQEAQAELKSRGMASKVVGKGTKVLLQIPAAGAVLAESQQVYLLTEEQSKLTLPSLVGLSLRDALQVCSSTGKRCVTEGDGYVVKQMDAKLNGEPVVKLTLQSPSEQQAAKDAALNAEKNDDSVNEGKDKDTEKGTEQNQDTE